MLGLRDCHPIVSFAYFAIVIVFSCVFIHPICLGASLAGGFVCSVLINGGGAALKGLRRMAPVMLAAALINPLFNHEGATILAYFPNGNPLTLESVVYGFAAAAMIGSVMCWFSCFNSVMTSDKLIYLFGRIMPSISLILSMTLRFVPEFTEQLKVTANAQKCIGRGAHGGSIVQRAKNGLTILSAMMTWALENSIEKSDSMRSRGYGLRGRTSFSIFKFAKDDAAALAAVLILAIYVIIGGANGGMYFKYFPVAVGAELSPFAGSVFAAYAVLCFLPIFGI